MIACVALFSGTLAPHAFAAGDAARGARVFQQCAACHSVQAGRHLTGPSLRHVWGRKAGTAEGFLRYSNAVKQSGVVWDEETLQRWLADPQSFIPGNTMPFSGLRDARERSDVIAYLHAVSEGKAPAPGKDGMGGMMGGGMMGQAEPADLRKAGEATQVASIRHCRDTYVVRTRDGKTRKVWEYNLRLKTDSSERGPRAGTPVMTESGMRGDRFSIVFAAPAEISRTIQDGCGGLNQ
jgi:cytochrome c